MNKMRLALLSLAISATQISYAQITSPAPYCAAGYDDGFMPVPHYISNVKLGALNNTSGTTQYSGVHYAYYNTVTAPALIKGNSYPLSITHDGGVTIHFVAVYIDFNHNNSFGDPGERVLQQTINNNSVTNPSMANITIPATAATGITRMRVMVFEDDEYTFVPGTNATPCTADAGGSFDWGETEDYNVNITGSSTGTSPVAAFTVNATTGSTNTIFSFTDNSTNNPSARSWSFSPNNVSYQAGGSATTTNPSVLFTTAGVYTVKLKVSNASGSDSMIKTDYITVSEPSALRDLSLAPTMMSHPNPAKDYLNINPEFKGSVISITDVQGRTLFSTPALQHTSIDLRNIPAGLYFLRIMQEQHVYVQKISIQK
ncbi:GEVED domain-containing protein [Taibaiella sp. KBW10]|uniref:GEVED domain-containing protein n=1 Tax=Taibaiella sp. KBW10 TaxID=2153357 RepID=UPI0013159231|nr:GEVED domain-containing protein [Taibaiella sp. KBW10]